MQREQEFGEIVVENASDQSEWASGWKVVLAATLGCSASVFYLGGIMTLVKPLNDAFGWSRAEVMSSLLVITVIMLFTSPMVGGLVDRFGARRVVLTGMIISLPVTSAVGLTGPEIWTWYAIWILSAFSASLTLPMVWTVGVAEHFVKNQGKAVAITLCGTGLATATSVPLASAVYLEFGWRAVFPVLTIASFAVAFPLVWFFFRDTPLRVRQSTGQDSDSAVKEGPQGLRLTEAARSPRLWLLTAAMFLVGAAMNGLLNHLPSLLTDDGFSLAAAAGMVALIGPCSILGRLITGFLFDFINARLVGVMATAIPLIAVFILSRHLTSYGALIPAVIIIGVFASAEAQVAAYLVPKYFGYKSYGKIFGVVFGFMLFGMGFGPFLGGLIFDMTGSYDQMILSVAIALMVSAVMIASLGRYPESWSR